MLRKPEEKPDTAQGLDTDLSAAATGTRRWGGGLRAGLQLQPHWGVLRVLRERTP